MPNLTAVSPRIHIHQPLSCQKLDLSFKPQTFICTVHKQPLPTFSPQNEEKKMPIKVQSFTTSDDKLADMRSGE